MALSRPDLNALIDEIIKVHPDATDTDKLQGKRHRELLKAFADYVDSANSAASGEFPFDWTVPSNAFNNYSNKETTFSKGMWKFLHRDMGPAASLVTGGARRPKGSSNDVVLSWDITVGSSPLKTLTVAGQTIDPVTHQGHIDTITQHNTDTTFSLYVTDRQGHNATATTSVAYRSPGFIITSDKDLLSLSDDDISIELLTKQWLGLLDDRNMDKKVTANVEKIYIAFPASMDPATGDATVIVNTLVDNSFVKKPFVFTNYDTYQNTYQENYPGFNENYVLYAGSNTLKGDYIIQVR